MMQKLAEQLYPALAQETTMDNINMDQLVRRLFAALNEGDLDMLARRVSNIIGPTEGQALQRSIDLLGCSMLLAPRTLAAKLGEDRDRYVPDLDSAPSAVISALPAQATSTPLVLSDTSAEPIPRVFEFDEIVIDPTVSFQDLVMSIYVGGIRLYRLSGSQFNPSTDNACVSRALCGTKVCVGALQSLDVRFTNVSGAALAATATVRVHGRISFPGDANFVNCWSGECSINRIPVPTPTPACACQK